MNSNGATKLLVSVRDAAEAEVALAAGAALIDVKEPRRGSLGAADLRTVGEVAQAVSARVAVSVALGELLDARDGGGDERSSNDGAGEGELLYELPEGVSFAKVGLAGCAKVNDWQSLWTARMSALRTSVRPVAVIYADWRTAAAPSPEDVLRVASGGDCAAVLIDTFDKAAGDLFSYWSDSQLEEMIASIRGVAPWAVVAGSLGGASVERAAICRPDYVAVRGAACRGGRTGTVDAECVRELVETLQQPAFAADDL